MQKPGFLTFCHLREYLKDYLTFEEGEGKEGEAFRQITYWLQRGVNYRNASPLLNVFGIAKS